MYCSTKSSNLSSGHIIVPLELWNSRQVNSKVIVKVILQPMVSWPVCLGVEHPSGAYDQIFITVRQLWVCWYGVPSLWWQNGSAIYNCCWLLPAQSFLCPSPAGLVIIFYCLRLETPQPGGSGPYIYIPQEQDDPVIPPGAVFQVNSHFHILLYPLGTDPTENMCHMSDCVFIGPLPALGMAEMT
jgi:hypothetical protein